MLRMGKLTDYGIVLMSYLAANRDVQHSAHTIAEAVKVPLPTVRKVLKSLSHGGLLKSERGVMGGYSLNNSPDKISVAEIITAIEGPIALTECVSDESHCEQETHCAVQTNWTRINNAVFHALDEVKLADMLAPQNEAGTSPIKFYSSVTKMSTATIQDGEFHD
ncbi:SUF system Fe-S cluster assembly regulator [Methylophaga thiooxydans]|uniref:FeS assembly SUF system regulator n=1 Tax=Methylophaga thiooxydans DMS010 TaxID=637616 RepID=C0N7T7_9GAMM|nr:SUF system Fe-S cluster assembly regulator [Methylophaga thiooxydans]EEF79426.1 FeS assembly SUF system regulator [Methylophaga thiooxydans DMS010]